MLRTDDIGTCHSHHLEICNYFFFCTFNCVLWQQQNCSRIILLMNDDTFYWALMMPPHNYVIRTHTLHNMLYEIK